jgi:hypothetical protein
MNLKVAIVRTGKSQRRVAAETERLTENRLSEIVRGWSEPRADEKEALARVLGQPIELLFEKSPGNKEAIAARRDRDDPNRPAA